MSCPIIIGGSHRSGTTLVRRLFNGHPDIACPPEIKFHKDLLMQFPSDPLAHGRLGSSIKAMGLDEHEWLDEFGHAFVRCHELSARRQGKRRWADKNPENALNIDHWHRLLSGRLHFVLVVRHPFDILASMAEIAMPRVLPATLVARAIHVKSYIESGMSYLNTFPKQSSLLRYEDLVGDTEATITRLLSDIGETFHPSMIREVGSEKHGVGLEDPKAVNRHTISADSVGRWRRSFSSEEIKCLMDILDNLMVKLNYAC